MYSLMLVVLLSNPVNNPLVLGKRALIHGQYRQAIAHLTEALDTLDLGSAGKAMVKFDIHKACEYLNDKRCSMDALLGFITYAELYMTRMPDSEWSKNPKLKDRIELAEVLIEAYWASISGKSCDTPERYCVLPKKFFLSIYASLIPFCGEANYTLLRSVNYVWKPKSIKRKDGISEVTSRCSKKYYFKESVR